MTTTTVTGTGRRSSLRQSEWQATTKGSSSQSMTGSIDKFPSFGGEPYHATAESGGAHLDSTVRYPPNNHWEGRNLGASWERTNGSIRNPKHRSRKSISEAFNTIRTRNASVSANAHELAQALRAPVSYRLIVR